MGQQKNTELNNRQKQWLLSNYKNPKRIAAMLFRWQQTYGAEYILKPNRLQLVRLAHARIKGKGFGASGNLFGSVKKRKEEVYVRHENST